MPLILASASTSRKALLEKLGLTFSICVPNIDESKRPEEGVEQLVRRLAEEKARKVAHTQTGLIIASDQVASLAGDILGKPHTHKNAVDQLQKSSGQTVTFYTSLVLLNTDTNNMQTVVEPFKVVFKRLSHKQIDHYLTKDQPYHCAGSFKSESLGISLFERLQGNDPNALIGLPLIQLIKMLENEGIDVLA